MLNKAELDDLIAHHALVTLREKIIPCSCGHLRELLQDQGPLLTTCSRCGKETPFTMADLVLLSGALISYASGRDKALTAPDVSQRRLWNMIGETAAWVKELKTRTLRYQLKVLSGGGARKKESSAVDKPT